MTKNDLLKDIQNVARKFQEENRDSNSYCTRNYYRKFGKYKKFDKYGSFTDLKKEAMEKEGINSDVFEYEKKILLIESENRELKTKYKQLLDQIINEDVLVDLYRKEMLPLYLSEPLKIDKKKLNDSKASAIFKLSDLHCGEVVVGSEVNYANEYNSSVMVKRLDRIFYYLVYYCKKFNIKDLYIESIGDLISGSIHDELIRTNEFTDVDAVFFLQDYLIKKLLEIESNFDSITVDFLVGNHGRLSQKPQYKTSAKLNWEYVLSKNIENIFNILQKDTDEKDRKIKINIFDSLFIVKKIEGRSFLITHGHFMTGAGTGGFAGLPYYSLAMSTAKMYGVLEQIGASHEQFDDVLIGHLHTTGEMPMFNGGVLYINGCIVGTNEFSLYKMKSVAKVEQTLLLVENGHVTNKLRLRGIE